MEISRPVWQRVLALFACLVFILCFYGRLTAQAVFGVDDLIIGGVAVASLALVTSIMIINMESSGLGPSIREAAAEVGQDVKEFMGAKVEQWINATQGNPGNFIKGFCDAVLYNPDGTLVFEEAAAQATAAFGSWLGQNGVDVPTSSDSIVSSTSDLDVSPYSQPLIAESTCSFKTFAYIDTYSYNNGIITLFSFTWNGSTSYFRFLCNSSSIMTGTRYIEHDDGSSSMDSDSATLTRSYTYDGKTVYYFSNAVGNVSPLTCVNLGDYNSNSLNNDLGGRIAWTLFYGATSTGSTSGLDVWNDNAADGLTVDPTDVLAGSIGELSGAIANVGDYVTALADAIAGIANPALPVIGVGDIPISIPADITIPVDPAIPDEKVDALPITGEDTTPAYQGTDDYTLALADFFPFCIPFDIYKMLSLLAADPVAPAFTYQFYKPGGGTIPIEIDLSDFNSVAAVLRTIETLGFCVGLGFITKKLLFGS